MSRKATIAAVVTLLIVLGSTGLVIANRVIDRGFQINTAVRMKTICELIERETRALEPSQSVERARSILLSRDQGLDAWHRQLIFVPRVIDGRFSYILVSLGSDGKADRPTDEYFSCGKSDIRGRPKLDIVFRDGDWVTNAFKE